MLLALAPALRAQRTDSAKVGVRSRPRADTVTFGGPTTAADSLARLGPPIRPRTALLRSLLIPGWGQASLDRGTAGALFATLELGSIAMLVQSKKELSQARRLARDSIFVIDDDGQPARAPNPYAARIAPRKQQVEDWTALLIFTHLLSAADAFVSAHLWDVRVHVKPKASADRATTIDATIPW